MQIEEFGRLPVVYEGRAEPLDPWRATCCAIFGQANVCRRLGKIVGRQPAIRWLLDVIARPQDAAKHRNLRIDSIDLLDNLGLKRRQGYRYSISEFASHIEDLDRQAELATAHEGASLTIYQKKVIELVKKLRLVRLLGVSFDPPEIDHDKPKESLDRARMQLEMLSRLQPVLSVPPDKADLPWETFAAAWFQGLVDRVRGQQPNPAMISMTAMIVAYSKQDAEAFNSELAKYENWLAENRPEGVEPRKVAFEDFFNRFEPFYCAWCCMSGRSCSSPWDGSAGRDSSIAAPSG